MRKAAASRAVATAAALTAVLTLAAATLPPPADAASASGPAPGADAAPVLYKGWRVAKLKVLGAPRGLGGAIKTGLALSGGGGPLGPREARLYPHLLEEDLARIRLFLARQGYPRALVAARLEPSRGREAVTVVFDISPGAVVTVARAEAAGLPPALAAGARRAAARLVGKPCAEPRLETVRRELVRLQADAGHARADVLTRVSWLDSTSAEVSFSASPGEVHTFRQILTRGVPDDLAPLVRRTVHIQPGQVYSPRAVAAAQDHLRLLELFRQVRLTTPEAGPGRLDLDADLTPRDPRTLQVGAGFWTEEYLKLGGRWTHRNLLQAGRGVEISAAYSRFRQSGALSSWWPALLGARTRGAVQLRAEREREESYATVAAELELSASYRPTLLTQLRGGVVIGTVDVDIRTAQTDAFSARSGRQVVLTAGWSRDSADDLFFPTSGTVAAIAAECAPPGLLSRNEYLRGEMNLAGYRAVMGGAVLAGRLAVGAGAPLGESVDLLPNKRFYAGGSTSMRGFRRRKLGPQDVAGAPLGGEAKLEAAAELRFPLWRLLRGAVFADAGQVWEDRRAIDLGGLELALGPGLMVLTPVGPVRADLGWRVTDGQPDQPRAVFQLAIGNPF